MIPTPSDVRVWLAIGRTDMRRGMNGLALQVQEALQRDPHICGGRDYVAAVTLEPVVSRKSAGWSPHNS
jgi:transposase